MRSTLALLIATAVPGAALAGDFATLNPLGFSADGGVFAFEQYGVQDGSGFPYSQIFFLDVEADRLLAPSPISVRLDEDGASLAAARDEARGAAATLLETHEPALANGAMVAANPPSELTADPYRVAFVPRAIEPAIDAPVELRLSLVPMPDAPEICTAFGRSISGFQLTRVGAEPGEVARLVHLDQTLPDSRNCPYDYRIAQIHVPDTGSDAPDRAVALIGIKGVGFEGPDMRYIAVPVPLD